jgi:hypothetical protein
MSVVNTKIGTPPGYAATSATSLTIGTGSQTFLTQANLAYTPGAFVTLSAQSSPTSDYMSGIVTAYNTGTGSMTVSFTVTLGSGTFNAWNLNLGSGPSIVATASPLVLEPTTLTLSNGLNNNVSIGANSFADITGPTGAFTITGITGGITGRTFVLWNTTNQPMTLSNNNASSTATNRIFTNTNTDITIPGENGSALFVYDGGLGYWVVVSYAPPIVSTVSQAQTIVNLSNGANNNVALGGSLWVQINGPTASYSITGFSAGNNGDTLWLLNGVAEQLTLVHDSSSSSVGNQIGVVTGAPVVLATRYSTAFFKYGPFLGAGNFWVYMGSV